ncbi:hypothetical protein E2C01_051536 [Portunus trituberculatus]|uniref:Uncharacterized protein n=1 Tax=Portunus trituberculatus TaxID=210409 RepID=A0A5B7GJE3_PORTR|nr:hypothetical protein [Portunus trituberculatus]
MKEPVCLQLADVTSYKLPIYSGGHRGAAQISSNISTQATAPTQRQHLQHYVRQESIPFQLPTRGLIHIHDAGEAAETNQCSSSPSPQMQLLILLCLIAMVAAAAIADPDKVSWGVRYIPSPPPQLT